MRSTGLIKTCAHVGILFMAITNATSSAHDFGVVSQTYPISEPDIRAVILGQLARKNMKDIGNKMAQKAKGYTDNLNPITLPPLDTTKTHYVDPSIRIKKDFYIPKKKADGSLDWELEAPAGTRLNMLKHVRPVTAFLIVNVTSTKQRRLAIAALKDAPYYIKVLVSSGNPAKLAKKLDNPVYRASPWMIKKFQVEHEPALVRPGYGKHVYRIAVTEFGPPWTVKTLHKFDPMKATSISEAKSFHNDGSSDDQ